MRRTILAFALAVAAAAPCSVRPTTTSPDSLIEFANNLAEENPDSALSVCAQLSQEKLGPEQESKLLYAEATARQMLGEHDNAVDAYVRCIAAAREADDSATMATAYTSLGACYRIGGQPDSALASYQRALKILDRIDEPAQKSVLLTSIAVFYANQGRFDESIAYGRRAYDLALNQADDIEATIYAGQTLSQVLFLRGDTDEGLKIARSMAEEARRLGKPLYMVKVYSSIVYMHHVSGNRDSVDYYLNRAESLLDRVPPASVEALGFLEQKHIILNAYGRYRESLAIQRHLLSLEGANTFMPFNKLYLAMARNYSALGDMGQASRCYERAVAMTDSLHGLEIDRQLSEFDTRYRVAEQQLSISRLEAEKARHRAMLTIWIAVSALVVAMLILYFVLRSRRGRREAEMAVIKARLEGIDRERERLARDLHDGVCNDLVGLSMLISSKSADRSEIAGIVDNVRDEIRSISHELMPPKLNGLTLGRLLLALALKSDGTIHVDTDETADIPSDTAYQLYRIVQEYTGNIRKHSDADKIEIKTDFEGKEVRITIIDNASSAPEENRRNGIGRDSISRRLEYLGGKLATSRRDNSNEAIITVNKS